MSNAKELTNQLWDMANKLRNTMDASEYKNFILPFMCYRYLSEHQEEYANRVGLEDFYTSEDQEEIDGILSELVANLGYAIEPQFTWASIVEKIEQHTIKPSDFMDMFASFTKNAKKNATAGLETVFAELNLGDSRLGSSTHERAHALNQLVMLIHDYDFKDESGRDILGDVYEYLIGNFAASAGKKGGEFYTPHEVSQILARIVIRDNHDEGLLHVYDPTMGSGSLLLTVQQELQKNSGRSVDFYGKELNITTYNLARMNLLMHGVSYKKMSLQLGDTLSEQDWPIRLENGVEAPQRFDAVVANPPYSQNWEIKSIDRSKDVRFQSYGVAPASKADFAFVLHGLHHLSESGTMAIVLPHGVLFRGASEAKIRQKLIEENLLDAVIGLPANLFFGTSIPTCILVFKGRKARSTRNDILFIDASKDFVKEKNKNRLTEKHLERILDAYAARVDVEKYAHVATLEEIKQNDYNLNIPRYVDTFEAEEVRPLDEIAKDLKGVEEEITTTTQELKQLLGQLTGTTEEAKKELEQFLQLFE